jgi:hypothetical protein
MSWNYYAKEIPLAKLIIKNYLILRCCEEDGFSFIYYCRSFYFRRENRQELFIKAYKLYLDTLSYLEPHHQKHVSFTIFKRLFAKERRKLFLIPPTGVARDYTDLSLTPNERFANTYEIVEFIRTQE